MNLIKLLFQPRVPKGRGALIQQLSSLQEPKPSTSQFESPEEPSRSIERTPPAPEPQRTGGRGRASLLQLISKLVHRISYYACVSQNQEINFIFFS